MKKSRYTEEQIAFALKQAETGTPMAEVIRQEVYERSEWATHFRAHCGEHDRN